MISAISSAMAKNYSNYQANLGQRIPQQRSSQLLSQNPSFGMDDNIEEEGSRLASAVIIGLLILGAVFGEVWLERDGKGILSPLIQEITSSLKDPAITKSIR